MADEKEPQRTGTSSQVMSTCNDLENAQVSEEVWALGTTGGRLAALESTARATRSRDRTQPQGGPPVESCNPIGPLHCPHPLGALALRALVVRNLHRLMGDEFLTLVTDDVTSARSGMPVGLLSETDAVRGYLPVAQSDT